MRSFKGHCSYVFALALSATILAGTAMAQGGQPAPQVTVAASSFATTEVHVTGRNIGGQWMRPPALLEGPSKISISYGQPHARGRQIIGGLVPYDQVWRLGANRSTTLTTDVDVTLGGTFLPHGVYSLYALPSKSGWQLIINKQVGQWGTDYDASQDVARIPLRVKTLSEPVESLTMYLIPTLNLPAQATEMPHGELKIVWEKTELTTDWKVGR